MIPVDQPVADHHTVVACRVAGSERFEAISFDCGADVAEARRWLASMRHVGHVEIDSSASGWSCYLNGVGHRLPVQRRVPLRVGLGLAELGVPVVVHGDAQTW